MITSHTHVSAPFPAQSPRPLVYICSPYAADTLSNIEAARSYSRFAVDYGCIPITPHLLFPQFMRDAVPAERALALSFGMELLSFCDALWVFGDHVSPGMAQEIQFANEICLPVRYFLEVSE